MKKSKASNFVVFVTLLAVITLILVAATYAKYTEGANTSGTAMVAKWNVAIKNGDQPMTDSVKVVLTDTTLNGKVKADHIAPGTDGAFGFSIDASGSEVAVDYVIEISNLSGAPDNFFIEGPDGNKITKTSGTYTLKGTIDLKDVGTELPLPFTWKWPYETGDITNGIAAGDADDNTAGTSATHTETGENSEISFNVKITAVQANPEIEATI